MKQIRFSDLPTSSQVNEADVFPIIQEGDNKKAQQSSIKDYTQYKNIPKVNGRALSGNVTLDELGAQAPGEYLTEKELLDADLVTKVENANKADKNYGAENSGKYLGTDENGEIAPIDVKFSNDNKIIKMAQGNPTIINDSADGRLQKLGIYGQSEQDGTPTPESPVEIISKEVSEIKVTGSNILPEDDKSFTTNNFYICRNNGFKLKANTKYILNVSQNVDGLYIEKFGSQNEHITFVYGDSKLEYTPTEDMTVYFQVYTIESTDFENTGFKMWLNVDIAKEYEQYKEQKITLSEPITLRGVPISSGGNVIIDGKWYIGDVICDKDGVVGIERNVAHYEITGNENVVKFTDGTFFFISGLPRKSLSSDNGLCTHCKYLYVGGGNDKVGICVAQRSVTCRFNLKLETVEEYKALFKQAYDEGNPFKVDYHAEPTFEPLPEEIQAQYKALKSYYPNTVIQTGCWNEVEYEVSLQSFVQDMYEKIKEVNNNNKLLL